MKRLRLLLWVLVGFAASGAILLLLRQPNTDAPSASPAIAPVTFGGPFTLVGGDGRPFSSSRLAGRPHAIFFGFTHCPDVCPTTLARLVRLRRLAGNSLDIVFITVDPDRDGPVEVARYSELFGEPVIGLTGSPGQIEQVKKQFGIFSRKVPDGNGDYSVDHTATVLLFDRAGKFTATISAEENDEAALAKLKRIAA